MKTESGTKFYVALVPAIFITVMVAGKLLHAGEALRYRELLMFSAIMSLTVYLLVEKSRHRKNHLALVSNAKHLPSSFTSDLVVTSSKAKHKRHLMDTAEQYQLLIQNS